MTALLRWTIRIVFMLLLSLTSRAILSDPRMDTQIETSVSQLKAWMKQDGAPAEETDTGASSGAPTVRAMPSSRVPVRRPGQSG